MQASICRDGRLPSLVNRKTPHRDNFPGLPLNRTSRISARHLSKCRGTVDKLTGTIRTWSKRHVGNIRREMARRLDETGKI